MKEYERRIQEHQKRLPHLRERVAATAVLFVVGILMLSTVTFSWLTLSVAPEASNISMSISTNGSLEIALAHEILRDESGNPILDENGNVIPLAPGASSVGDSLKDIVQRNTTWGNLVNLSDASYGLENIVLRPATLKIDTLLSQPLFAAKYTADGRIEKTQAEFAYAQWNTELKTFTQSDYKGVKSISSIKETGTAVVNPLLQRYNTMLVNVGAKFDTAGNEFRSLATSPNMSAINGLMSTYMNGTLNQAVDKEICQADDIETFYVIMNDVLNGTMQHLAEAYMELVEIYQIDTYGLNNYEAFTDAETFCSQINSYLVTMNSARKASGKTEITIATIKQFAKDYLDLKTQINNLAQYRGSTTTTWGEIKNIVNFVVNINTCEVNGKTISTLLGSLSQNMSDLSSMLSNGAEKNNAVVKAGLLKRLDLLLYKGLDSFYIPMATITIQRAAFEKRISGQNALIKNAAMNAAGFGGSAQTKEVYANVKTDAPSDTSGLTAYKDSSAALKAVDAEIKITDFVAQDTYGLSIDFWIKTNSARSFLLLEGEVQYTEEPVKKTITITDENGNSTEYPDVQIYLATVVITNTVGSETEESKNENQEIYKLDDGVWRFLSNNAPVEESGSGQVEDENGNLIDASYTIKISGEPVEKTNRVISGYSGANRIWTEEELLSMSEAEYRTTQGAGSCYTFYADPAEAEQIMDILSALKIAFVDQNGNLMGSARLATELCFSEYGKHTVPIVLENNCTDTGMVDDNGDPIYAITRLEQNQPTLITAIIYLDGAVVSNDKVLSSSNIEGRFNIQFGSTDILEPILNEELMGDEIRVSGSVSNNGVINPTVDFDKNMETDGYKATVKINVTGKTPSSVYGYFLRKISETQGTKQEKLVFTKNASGEWVAEMSFHSPGVYILRSVIVDGVERDLETSETSSAPTVTINGFSCSNFHGSNPQNHTYRTASSFVTEKFYIKITAKDQSLVPKNAEAVFIGDNGKVVTVNLTDSNGDATYEGLALFQSSGKYTCQYVLVNGEYYEIATPYTRDIYTGLRVAIWLSQNQNDNPFTEQEKPVGKEILSEKGYQYIFSGEHNFDILMRIYDNAGNTMDELTDINLFYSGDLDASLRWDASSRYYVGQFPPIDAPGTYTFKSVVVGREVINSARSAMSITAIPNSPVSYSGLDGEIPVQVVRIDGASTVDEQGKVSLKFVNAESAEVFGLFTVRNDTETRSMILKAVRADTDKNIYTFTIPDDDGFWQLTEIKMSFVYDGSTKTYFMGDEGETSLEDAFVGHENDTTYYITLPNDGDSETPNLWENAINYYVIEAQDNWTETKVICSIIIPMSEISVPLEYTGNGFMTAYSVNNSITFDDLFNGDVVADISDVKITYTHQPLTMAANGGYTWAEGSAYTEIITIHLDSKNTDNGKITFSNSVAGELKLAGDYLVVLTYKYNGIDLSVPLDNVNVKTNIPTVTISAISPTGTFDADKTGKGSGHASGNTPTFSDTSATVYFKCAKSTIIFWTVHNYTRPSVTIKLSGLGTAKSAELSFVAEDGNTARVYNGNTQTGTYVWTADNTAISRNIGYYQSKSAQTDDKTPAGTITATQLTLIGFDNVAYTFTVPTITINNPY